MDINKEKILKSVISSSITNIENMIEGKDLINNKKINKDFVNLNNNKYR